MIQSDYVSALAGGRLIQGLDYLRVPGLEPKGYDAFLSGGHAWAVPFYYDAQLVFYNRALVKEDPPANWCLEDLGSQGAEPQEPREGAHDLERLFGLLAPSLHVGFRQGQAH